MGSLVESFAELTGYAASPSLSEALDALVARSKEEVPGIELAPDVLVRHAAERMPAESDPAGYLPQLRAGDLRLACACARGDDPALALFATTFGELVDITLARIGLKDLADDVRQTLLRRLLFPNGERPPAIALYSGRGPLRAYLRVAVTREAIALTRKRDRERPDDDALIDRAVSDADPETAALKARYGPLVKEAFQAAFQALPSRDRRLLRYHYVEQLTTRQMGVMLGIHSSTVSRQLTQTRARVLQQARQGLAESLGANTKELASIVRLVESQLDLSLYRVLGPVSSDRAPQE